MQSGSQSYREFSALMKQRAFADAVSLAERQSVAAGDKSEFWLTQLSGALRESGKFREAIDAADKACRIAPGSAWPMLARAEALLKREEYDAAAADFEAAQSDERAALRARKGLLQCLGQAKSWESILSLLAQWELPKGMTHSWRVKALMELGRTDEADAECREWLAECPDDPQALWKSVELQIAREGVEPVLLRMGRLAKIPGKPTVYGEIYASLCTRSGSLEGAAEQYEKLVKRESSPSLLRKQAFALAKSGREDRAVPLMEELLRLSPDDMYINAAYIPACKRLGDMGRAWTFYHELISLHPDRKTIYGRLKRVSKMLETVPGATPSAAGGPGGNRTGAHTGRDKKQ
jgi:tetratricopeptide (TPR) repeat protein